MGVNGKKSIFYRLLGSYILVSAIPLLVMGSIFYYLNIINLRQEVMSSNLSKLTQVKDQIDFNLLELKDITLHVSSNPNIFASKPRNTAEKVSDIIPQLQAYIDNSPILDDILLYQRGDENVYLSDREYHYSVFGRQVKGNLDWAQANFFRSLNIITFPTSKRIEVKDEGFQENERLLVYMFPIPLLSTPPKGTIVYMVKEAALVEIVENYLGVLNGYAFIFDDQYNGLVSHSKGMPEDSVSKVESTLRFSKGTGIYHTKLGERNFAVMRIVSKDTGWSYVVAMPESSFYERVNMVKNIILATTLILVFAGCVLALVISINNYRPVKMLLSHIAGREAQPMNEKGKNEFELIRSTFDKTFDRNRELVVQVDTQRLMVGDQCLLKIIRGKVKDAEELEYLLKCSNIQLNGSMYFVILLSIQHIHTSVEHVERALRLVEEACFPAKKCYGLELAQDKEIALILSVDEAGDELKPVQQSIAQNIASLLKKNLDWRPVLGIGNPYSSILQLNTSFLEASAAVYDNLANRHTNIHFFCDIDRSQEQVYWYPITEQALLIQSLKQGDKAVALSTLDTMVEKIAQGTTSYLMVRCVCFDIINNIIKTINQMSLESFDREIKEMAGFATLEEFKTRLGDFACKFCEYIEQFKENRTNELKNNVISFLRE